MKTEQCLMCVVCFVLGWFVHNVVGKCEFGREHLTGGGLMLDSKKRQELGGPPISADDMIQHGGGGYDGQW